MTTKLKDLPEYEKFQKYSNRAHSPLLEVYAKMTPEEIEKVLVATIPRRAPSLAERAKNMFFGMEINPPYDPREVQIARIMAQSKHAHNDEPSEQYYDDLMQRAQYAKMAAIAHKINYDEMRSMGSRAEEAAKERKAQPAQNVRDAERKYQDLRVNAYNSAITNKLVDSRQTYDIISAQRDAARQDSEALKSRQAAQQKKEHEQRMNDFIKEGELRKHRQFFGLPTGGRRGGKSKRVKSKRNKRSTKRRNARK